MCAIHYSVVPPLEIPGQCGCKCTSWWFDHEHFGKNWRCCQRWRPIVYFGYICCWYNTSFHFLAASFCVAPVAKATATAAASKPLEKPAPAPASSPAAATHKSTDKKHEVKAAVTPAPPKNVVVAALSKFNRTETRVCKVVCVGYKNVE